MIDQRIAKTCQVFKEAMQKIKIFLAFSIIILATSACNALAPTAEPSPPTATAIIGPTQTQPSITAAPAQAQTQVNIPQTADEVVRVSLTEAKRGFDNKSAIFVDARTQSAYETSHIKGALYFGDFELKAASPNFDKSQWIITYCT
jgi:3-mercaptopyruvate sulfurtransferase SseA